jgi:hypothetical protein
METIKRKINFLFSKEFILPIDFAISSAAGALILLSIFFTAPRLGWIEFSVVVFGVAIASWRIAQRIITEKK